MTPEQLSVVVTLGNVFFTPVIVLVTLWVRGKINKETRRETREDGLIKSIVERVETCEKRHADRDREIKEIRTELKHRDDEYIALYKEHTTLRAKYEVLLGDHDELKKQYQVTVSELEILKKDMVKRAEVAVHTVKNLENQTSLEKQLAKNELEV